MKRHVLMFAMLAAAMTTLSLASAQEVVHSQMPPCEPGYQWVQEIGYQDIDHPCCKRVPNMRKKWVYCSKPDYFCVPECRRGGCGNGGCDRDSCGDCFGPYCRKQLLKKQVECQYGTKCVVEITKEKVPCVIWKKVPCGTPSGVAPAPMPSSLPAPMPATTPTSSVPAPASSMPHVVSVVPQ